MKRNKKQQQGFTLVEISIVLLIIGLLLGGILKGQTLLNSARVRNLANQQSGIQAAYYGFIDRYRAKPGDMLASEAQIALGLGTEATGGNNNGIIDNGSWEEAAAVWQHLAAADFIVGQYNGATNAAEYTRNAPKNAFGAFIILANINNYFSAIDDASPSRLSYLFGRQIPANILRELDIKLDDGNPDSGILRASKDTGGDFGMLDQTSENCITTAAPRHWDISINQSDCGAVFLY